MTAPPHHHDDLAGAVDALASEGAIRRLMAAYLDAVDRSQDGTRIAGFFTDDGVFEGVGHLLAFLGCHQGRDAIAGRFDATREHLTFSLHLPSNESITVDGDHATGTWTYLQAAVNDGQPVWVAGRWRNRFARVQGAWRIARRFRHLGCRSLGEGHDHWPGRSRPAGRRKAASTGWSRRSPGPAPARPCRAPARMVLARAGPLDARATLAATGHGLGSITGPPSGLTVIRCRWP